MEKHCFGVPAQCKRFCREQPTKQPHLCNFEVRRFRYIKEWLSIIIWISINDYQSICGFCVAQESKYLEFVPARRVFHHWGGEVRSPYSIEIDTRSGCSLVELTIKREEARWLAPFSRKPIAYLKKSHFLILGWEEIARLVYLITKQFNINLSQKTN